MSGKAPSLKAGDDLDVPWVSDAADAPVGLSSIRPDFTRRSVGVRNAKSASALNFLPAAAIRMEGQSESDFEKAVRGPARQRKGIAPQ